MKKIFFTFVLTFLLTFSVIRTQKGMAYQLEYLFFRDRKFTNTLARVWGNWTWNKSVENGGFFDGYSRFCSSGGAELFYNESGGKGWGGAIFLQGTHPHTGFRDFILGGINRQSAVLKEYVSFKRADEIPENEFILSAKVMVHERNYTDFGDSVEAVSNVGIDLMFGYDDADYYDLDWNHSVAIHADVILSRVWWDNETKTLHHNEIGESSVAPFGYDADYHLPLIRGKIETLGIWNTFEIDLAEIVETIFNLLQGVNTIHFRGVQVYIDGISSYTKATYSWVFTKMSSEIFEPVFQRGMSYRHYPYPYDSAESNESLTRMAAVGVEYVALNVWWEQENVTSTEIYRKPGWTATDQELRCAVDKIHELGMKVMLKPMVSPQDWYNHWRGEFPGCPEWFDSYRENIANHYAEFAEANTVDLFCIGCEFKGTISKTEEWERVIREVEKRYSGPITYAAIWDTCRGIEWCDSLDYVGIDAYFPLTDEYDPTLEELKQAWSLCAEDIESWHSTINKPIIFTEIGYRSGNGTNIRPWEWKENMTLDLQEQVDCYEAAFQVLWNKPWFYGLYWWIWESDPEAGGSNCTDFTPQNKPAQGVITHWYSPDQISYRTLLEQIKLLNSTLQEQINSLNSALTSGQEAIINELSNIRNLMYVFIATTVILIIATIYLATKTKVSKAKT